jgi:predicted nucleic acid-binding protein
VLACDASLAVELSLDRIGEEASSSLGNNEPIGPPLLWSEVPSVLHEMAFRGEISQDLGEQALQRFLGAKLQIAERRPEGPTRRAWQLAGEFGWAKTYDAEYLAVADLLGCRLVTLDVRLHRGAKRLGFVVTPAELATEAPSTSSQSVDE